MSDWELVGEIYKYKENVVDAAKEYQGGDEFCCIDNYSLKELKAKEKFVKLKGTSSGYFTTIESLEKSDLNSIVLNEGIQVGPWFDEKTGKYTYRVAVDIYELKNDILAAHGVTLANTQYGEGGSLQNVIPNFKELESKEVLVKGEEKELICFEITREQYDLMQDKGKQQVLKRDLQCNLYEKSRLLEMNTKELSKEQIGKRNELVEQIDNKISKIDKKLAVSKSVIGDIPSPCYDPNIEYLKKKNALLKDSELEGNKESYYKHHNIKLEEHSRENSKNIMRKVQKETLRFPDEYKDINIEGLKYSYDSNKFRKEINYEQYKESQTIENLSKSTSDKTNINTKATEEKISNIEIPKIEGINQEEYEKVQELFNMYGEFPSGEKLAESITNLENKVKSVSDQLDHFKEEKVTLESVKTALNNIDKNSDIYNKYESSGFDKDLLKTYGKEIANYEKSKEILKTIDIKDKAELSKRFENYDKNMGGLKLNLEQAKNNLNMKVAQISDSLNAYQKYRKMAGPEMTNNMRVHILDKLKKELLCNLNAKDGLSSVLMQNDDKKTKGFCEEKINEINMDIGSLEKQINQIGDTEKNIIDENIDYMKQKSTDLKRYLPENNSLNDSNKENQITDITKNALEDINPKVSRKLKDINLFHNMDKEIIKTKEEIREIDTLREEVDKFKAEKKVLETTKEKLEIIDRYKPIVDVYNSKKFLKKSYENKNWDEIQKYNQAKSDLASMKINTWDKYNKAKSANDKMGQILSENPNTLKVLSGDNYCKKISGIGKCKKQQNDIIKKLSNPMKLKVQNINKGLSR